VIVNDDIFSQLSRYATPVNAHIKMKDDSSKTVQDGGLWYEETLPPDTLLYVGVVAQRERKAQGVSADQIQASFNELFKTRRYLQLGGNETLGMGWCKVMLL
jgi:CRISPR-associated protein Cmr4